MAKLFYTLEEASAKLNKSADEITGLVAQGKLREFRDHEDKFMFKVEEVDLLAGDSADNLELDLSADLPAGSDSFELDLSDSGAGTSAASGKSDSPVGLDSVNLADDAPFELDLGEASAIKPAAKSAGMSKAPEADTFGLDLGASGSMAAASGARSAPNMPAAAGDDLTLELDLGDEPAPAKPAPAKAPARNALDDSMGSIAATPAATSDDLSLEGSNMGAAASRADSAVGGSSISAGLGLEGPGSGSGLLDLTSDSESSSIGAALMDEAFSSDEGAEVPANASGIFGGEGGGESAAGLAGVAGAAAGAAAVAVAARGATSVPIFTSGPAAAEVYSGSWSGLGVGLLIPSFLAMAAAFAMVLMKTLGAPPEIAVMYAQDWMTWTGGLAGAIAVCGAIGFFVGKATE